MLRASDVIAAPLRRRVSLQTLGMARGMTRPRSLLAVLASSLALLASGCASIQEPGGPGGDRNTNGSGGGGGSQAAPIDDDGTLGSAAAGLLKAEPYTTILIEFAVVGDRQPSSGAVSHLASVLQDVTGKSVDTSTHALRGGDGPYSADEIRDLSSKRASVSEGSQASIWIAYLDGGLEGNDDAVGIAVAGTVAAVFPDNFRGGLLSNSEGVERAVLVHEVGHLLSLVEIGYESDHNRTSSDHPHHSENEDSVMHWAVESAGALDIFSGGPPDTFDQADRDDLQKIRNS